MAKQLPEFDLPESAPLPRHKRYQSTPTVPQNCPKPIAWARTFLIIAFVMNSGGGLILASNIESDPVRGGMGIGGIVVGMGLFATGWCIVRIAESCAYLAERVK